MTSNKTLNTKDGGQPNSLRSCINRIFSKGEPLCGWDTDDSVYTLPIVDDIGIEIWIKEKKLLWLASGIKRCELLFEDHRSYESFQKRDTEMQSFSESGRRELSHLGTDLEMKESAFDVADACYGFVHDPPRARVQKQIENLRPTEKRIPDVPRQTKKARSTKPPKPSLLTMLRFEESLASKRKLKVARTHNNFSRTFETRMQHISKKEQLLPRQISYTYGMFDGAHYRKRNTKGSRSEFSGSVRTIVDANSYIPYALFALNQNPKQHERKTSTSSITFHNRTTNTRQMKHYQCQITSPVHCCTSELLRECSLRTRKNLGSAEENQIKHRSADYYDRIMDYLKEKTVTVKCRTHLQGESARRGVEAGGSKTTRELKHSNLKGSKERHFVHSLSSTTIFPPILDPSSNKRRKKCIHSVPGETEKLEEMFTNSSLPNTTANMVGVIAAPMNSSKEDELRNSSTSDVMADCCVKKRSHGNIKEILLPPLKTTQFECPLKRLRDMADKRVQLYRTSCKTLEANENKEDALATDLNDFPCKGELNQEAFPGEMMMVKGIRNREVSCQQTPGRYSSAVDSGLGE